MIFNSFSHILHKILPSLLDQAKSQVKTEGKSPCYTLPPYLLTSNSSILVWHFSKLILFIATRSCLGLQSAAWTTAVAPLPEKGQKRNSLHMSDQHKKPILTKNFQSAVHPISRFPHVHTFPLARHLSHFSYGREKPESFFSTCHKKFQSQ